MNNFPAYFSDNDLNVADLDALCSQTVNLAEYPLAQTAIKNVLVYHNDVVLAALDDHEAEQRLLAEWIRALRDGPGVIVVKGSYPDLSVLDRSTDLFKKIIQQEKAAGSGQGDHFGTNERVWNSLQKACLADPDLFIDYYKNPAIALACRAWLGPHYQMTAQVNNVKPGGEAQSAHRDYHLGFQSPETVAQFPAHTQHASQYLTLQGAIAHRDMPLESGPTLFLPFSQRYEPGYLAYTHESFRDYFNQNHIQIPFEKGDVVFFSPALFHGAGTNVSETDRLANLIQISSAFGRPMEAINRRAMIEAVYPVLQKRCAAGTLSNQEAADVIASTADGYSFPTNLDSDPPIGGNAPRTAAQMMRDALAGSVPPAELFAELDAYEARCAS